MVRAVLDNIPVFKLYGEGQRWATPDLLHCETIAKRSRLHHWEIQPHRHADLCQLLYVRKGQAQIDIEGQQLVVREAALQVVPPQCVHGFRFSEDIDGYVVTLAAPLIAQLQAETGATHDVLAHPALYLAGTDRGYLTTLFSALLREYQNLQPGRDVMLHSLINVALVWVGRQATARNSSRQAPQRGRRYLAHFVSLIETHFREQPSVEHLAYKVGLSVAQLNNICRDLAGLSALQVVHQRMLLEAKRNLIYTSMTVAQVADVLGFADPAYFSRFFKRLTGLSPSDFRSQGLLQTALSARSS
jgi:AraC family transcriptional activator of pobA